MIRIIFSQLGLIFLAQLCVAQATDKPNNEKVERANEILNQARNAIYFGNSEIQIKSVSSKFSTLEYSKTTVSMNGASPETKEFRSSSTLETAVLFPKKVRSVSEINSEFGKSKNKTRVTLIANNGKFSYEDETWIDGKKNAPTSDTSLINDKRSPFSFNFVLTAERILKDANQSQFPLLLKTIGGENQVFEYVGRAESNGIVANVIEFIGNSTAPTDVNSGKQVEIDENVLRYFFDEKTKLLIMSTQVSSTENISNKITTFYTDYTDMNGILIPRKIKHEMETIIKKKMKVLGIDITQYEIEKVVDMTVEEFKINPEFPANTFEIKDKN